jgi:ATPase family associated with various cellular activities (AAA)/Winged helix domain, variant
VSELEARWLAENSQYLAEELAALRQRLEALAASFPAGGSAGAGRSRAQAPAQAPLTQAEEAAAPSPRQDTPKHRFLWSGRARALPPVPAPPRPEVPDAGEPQGVPQPGVPAGEAAQPPALVLLARRFGLTDFERKTLLLCAAMELDTRIPGLCARAQGDLGRRYPTFGLAFLAFDDAAWDVLSPTRPLRRWELIEISQQTAQPLVSSALKADERIASYLKGLNYLDDRLAPLVTEVLPDDQPLPASQQAVTDAIMEALDPGHNVRPLAVFQLLGSDRESKLAVAQAAANRLGLTLYQLTVDAVPAQAVEQEHFVRLWQRESALLPICLFVDTAGLDRMPSPQLAAILRICGRGLGLTFVGASEPWPELAGLAVTLEVRRPEPAEQRAVWTEVLGAGAGDQPSQLAAQFDFNVPVIRRLAGAAGSPADAGALWDACLRESRPSLEHLAQAIDANAGWDDLVLPDEEKNLLRQIANQVSVRMPVYDDWGFRDKMNRGLGISVLFAGDSGYGKTMAAEVMARELRLLLYRIDLSAVVSKYIGETEKNLRNLFDAAEGRGVVLFFDEADALFGKRSEVRDSHDRFANIEISYLLQRMEAYRGLAILATNNKSALDSGFLRRLRFIVDFPFPGTQERAAIWRNVFPARAPVAELDYDHLARFNLAGGSIHNAAVNAAFLAAKAGTAVTMPLVLDAVRTEFGKLGKAVNEADFRYLEPVEEAG